MRHIAESCWSKRKVGGVASCHIQNKILYFEKHDSRTTSEEILESDKEETETINVIMERKKNNRGSFLVIKRGINGETIQGTPWQSGLEPIVFKNLLSASPAEKKKPNKPEQAAKKRKQKQRS